MSSAACGSARSCSGCSRAWWGSAGEGLPPESTWGGGSTEVGTRIAVPTPISRANSDLGFGGSDQDTENSTAWTKAAQGRSCLLWSEVPAPQAW